MRSPDSPLGNHYSLIHRLARPISVAMASVLMVSTVAPAIASPYDVHAAKAAPPPKALVSKGVPTMHPHPSVPSPAPSGPLPATPTELKPGVTMLDEEGYLHRGVTPEEMKAWRSELMAKPSPERKGRLLIQVGEATLASHEPDQAQVFFDKAASILPKENPDRGLARFDSALCLFLEGKFEASKDAFTQAAKSPLHGIDRRLAAIYSRHAAACQGYHEQHLAMGIPQPRRLDPLCAVSAITVCLQGLNMPSEKKDVMAKVYHNGEGSNFGDLMKALPSLGLMGRSVSADDKGLQLLPKPIVAHVEHDHFVAVSKADKDGVTYVCSDCGPWPGGPVRLTWKQWHAQEADRYLVVAKIGSTQALTLESLPTSRKDGQGHVLLTSIAANVTGNVAAAEQALKSLGTSVIAQVWPIAYPFGICGMRGSSPHCLDCIILCAIQGSLSQIPWATLDPVNLATGEEEYEAPGALDVYNPIGPSVHWTHSYNSLANTTPNGFGSGWTHPYNVRIEDNSAMTGLGGGPSYLIMPNSARVQFTAAPSNAPTSGTPVKHLAVQTGYPMLIDWCYNSTTSGTYFVVTFSDRMKWTFEDCNGTSSATGRVYPIKIADRFGNYINLNWSTFTFNTWDLVTNGYSAKGLTSITDSSSNALLTVNYDSNARTTSVADRYSRSVYYSVSAHSNANIPSGYPQTSDEIDLVSQIVTTGTSSPPVRFSYGYANYSNNEGSETVPYLHTIGVPSPTGTGTSTATINYDGVGLVTDSIDANGNKITYGPGQRTVIGPKGIPMTLISANSARVQIKTSGGTVVQQYDEFFNSYMSATELINGTGQSVWTKTYTDSNTPYGTSSVTDGNGRTWTYTYDQFGHVVTVTTPKSVTTTNTYSYTNFALGELTSTQQGSKTATSYTYNTPSGTVATVSTAIPGNSGSSSTQTTNYTYDTLGNVTQISTPGNNATSARTVTFGYTTDGTYSQSEALNQPIKITDSLSKVRHLRYDSRNNLISDTDEVGNQNQAVYNIDDQKTTTTYAATGQTGTGNSTHTLSYLYPGGPATQMTWTDESGSTIRTVSFTYGAEGERLTESGARDSKAWTYDAAYHLKTLSDGNSNQTVYTYDLAGRPTKESFPGATGANFDQYQITSYDAVGNELSRTDGTGQVTNYTYGDTDGLLTAISYVGHSSSNVSLGYDSYDRLTSSSDGTGSETASYDDLNNVTGKSRTYTGLSGLSSSYTYYPDGSRNTMVNTAGTWTYYYDADGRCTSMSSPAGTSYSTFYDNGWESGRTLPNGTSTSYSYNALGLMTGLTNQTSTPTTLSQYSSFTFDGATNMTGLTASVPGVSTQGGATTYTYNTKNKLTQESSARSSGYTESFGYDSTGNPTTFNGTTVTFNSDNQQTSGGTFSYDGNGSPTTYKSSTFTYDPENRVTGIGSSWTAAYRLDHHRAWKQNVSTKTYFLYDGKNPVVELDSSGNVQAINVFAPDGLVARKQGGSWIQYTFDPQGNVAQRLNSSQTVLSSSIYDCYGAESSTGTPTDCFGFNARWGYYLDRETGLYLCEHRYYDCAGGRWINRDPAGYIDSANLYGYCWQKPTGIVDPSGLWGIRFEICVGALVQVIVGMSGDLCAGVSIGSHGIGIGGSFTGSVGVGIGIGGMAGVGGGISVGPGAEYGGVHTTSGAQATGYAGWVEGEQGTIYGNSVDCDPMAGYDGSSGEWSIGGVKGQVDAGFGAGVLMGPTRGIEAGVNTSDIWNWLNHPTINLSPTRW